MKYILSKEIDKIIGKNKLINFCTGDIYYIYEDVEKDQPHMTIDAYTLGVVCKMYDLMEYFEDMELSLNKYRSGSY